MEELAIRKSEVELKAEIESIKLGAKVSADERDSESKFQLESIKVGSDIALRNRQLDKESNKPPQGE